ncbi:MAG: hypothetical protein N3E49_01180 [Bacteroidia bacterium]|nr:hypothetical protein [Bacteroidia bacterium]
MQKTLLLWIGALSLSLIAFKEANSSQPPVGYSGAPNEGTCASCHAGVSTAPTIALTHNGSPLSTYAPGGAPLTLTLTVSHPSLSRYGFQLTVLSAQSGQQNIPNQGLATGSSSNVVLQTGSGGRRYIAHQGVSNSGTWTFEWTPPATNVGPITWYIAANAVNGNGSPSGDAPGTATLTLNPDQGASLPFTIQSHELSFREEFSEATLYNLEGQVVARMFPSQGSKIQLLPGLYILSWRTAHGEFARKIYIPN